ncbi:hypothetical protein P6B95_38470 [Streptomyces atratus]|uniref:hypothetical protein n=1 Tax=Streptomyces atratus TaxID=1893 RepID=UPI001670ECC0|nr:hypothetical protein [Streptomyces atratus]WPW32682.1 hypothetical protein P6B95_38470 [Streptomyces atratus]GGT45427.1 hypothetical protein GCM10010207_52140 [Streptomyces atratus]
MSKRTTARHQPAKKQEEPQPDVEFRARGFHVILNKVPWKVLTALAAAIMTKLISGHTWML